MKSETVGRWVADGNDIMKDGKPAKTLSVNVWDDGVVTLIFDNGAQIAFRLEPSSPVDKQEFPA